MHPADKFHQRHDRIKARAVPSPTLAWRVAVWCRKLANALEQREWPHTTKGTMLLFTRTGSNLGYPVYSITSGRGQLFMGTIQWSNQWREAKFTPAPDAVFNQRCLSEIFAMTKEFRR